MHIAIIMDGNRRWAEKQGWKKILGHKTGVNILKKVLDWCPKYNIKTFTVYALSTENLQRSTEELNHLFDLINEFAKPKEEFKAKNIKITILGNLDQIRVDTKQILQELVDFTGDCNGLLCQICLAYGGKDELIRCFKKIKAQNLDINEDNINKNLDSGLSPDLIIRTGGHKRLSNFLTWQSAYSELLFLDKMWPDFTEKDLFEAVQYLQTETRNFGK